MTDKGIDKREESLRVFSQTATIYDRIGPQIFAYFGQCLVELAGLDSGDTVLDVAAGRGALLFPVAAKVGPTGHVTAIDFSPDMVRETAKDIESRKLSHAEIRHMDAEQIIYRMPRSIGSCAALPFGCSLNPRAFFRSFTVCSSAEGE